MPHNLAVATKKTLKIRRSFVTLVTILSLPMSSESEALNHISSQIKQGSLLTPFSPDSLSTLDYLAALMEVSSPTRARISKEQKSSEFACDVAREYAHLYKRPSKVLAACDELEQQVREPGQVKHAVFVLLDGYGWNLLQAYNDLKRAVGSNSFIADQALRAPARTVFPATTSAALSAYGSLRLPAHHAQWGWHVRLSKNGQVVQPLAGDFEFSDELSADDVFKYKSVFPRLAEDEGRVVSGISAYGSTPFTAAQCGQDTPHVFSGATSLENAIPALQRLWADADAKGKPSFAYVYAANPDKVEHLHGPFTADGRISPGVLESIELLDAQMRSLCLDTGSPNQRLVLMMADHGQYTVESEVSLPPELRAMVETVTVEPATPSFHLKPDTSEQQFREAWAAAGLESKWRLLNRDQLLATGLLGPELGSEARNTLGDLTGIALGNYLLRRDHDEESWTQRLQSMLRRQGVFKTVGQLWEMRGMWRKVFAHGGHKGHHGGCKPSEMLVPVFVWSK